MLAGEPAWHYRGVGVAGGAAPGLSRGRLLPPPVPEPGGGGRGRARARARGRQPAAPARGTPAGGCPPRPPASALEGWCPEVSLTAGVASWLRL